MREEQHEKKGENGAEPLTWRNETRKLCELIPWQFNPRQIDAAHGKRLVHSREKFGQVEPISIGPNNQLYNGHQRLKQWGDAFGPDFVVDVRVASRELTEEELQELVILLHEGAVGRFDFDMLANWPNVDVPQLVDWGMSPYQLGIDIDLRRDMGVSARGEQPRPAGTGSAALHRCPKCGFEW